MKYLALLRGVNVGGNAKISMAEIKKVFEQEGLANVQTYINSGNVIFETSEKNIKKITKDTEAIFTKHFFPIEIVILTAKDLDRVIQDAPTSWDHDDVRKYVAFTLSSAKPSDFEKVVKLRQDVDTIKIGQQVVYMTTKMSGLTKSGFNKLIGTPIYKQSTWRNFNTVQKLAKLMAD